jgi:cell filamentation protein, protein adenylyltransferase
MPRSGNYVRQIEGYSAFIPAPLPPEPAIEIDGEMQRLLSAADRALGRLDGSIQTLPNPNLFVFMYVRKEAVLSSQIEGTQASFNDLLEVEASIFNPEQPNDVQEVLNYVNAMNYGLERLRELPISGRLIREIHERLLTGVRGNQLQPGQIRTSQNWIGNMGSNINEATFVPPPPSEVDNAINDFERFLHDDTQMPILLKIGLAHAQFETIHPFLDGNGRVGRLLITFLLCEREILETPLLYISHYFKENRQRYYDLLQGTRDTGDWEAWLKFFLEGIAAVSNQATDTARQIVGLREQHRNTISENFGRVGANGITVLEHLFQKPIISVNEIVDLINISYPAASNLISKFVEYGLINEITGNARNRRYRYTQYIRLFDGI